MISELAIYELNMAKLANVARDHSIVGSTCCWPPAGTMGLAESPSGTQDQYFCDQSRQARAQGQRQRLLERLARKPEARILGSDPAPAGSLDRRWKCQQLGGERKRKEQRVERQRQITMFCTGYSIRAIKTVQLSILRDLQGWLWNFWAFPLPYRLCNVHFSPW